MIEKINISRLLSNEIGYCEKLEIDKNIDEADLKASIIGSVKIMNIQIDEVLAEFDIKVKQKLVCDRCLKDFEQDEEINFSEIFSKNIEDDYQIINNEIEIIKPVYDEIVSKLPIKVLCNENCPGIKK
jgi:uncharacterized metal-binding protein YceD (DUF177 family)